MSEILRHLKIGWGAGAIEKYELCFTDSIQHRKGESFKEYSKVQKGTGTGIIAWKYVCPIVRLTNSSLSSVKGVIYGNQITSDTDMNSELFCHKSEVNKVFLVE